MHSTHARSLNVLLNKILGDQFPEHDPYVVTELITGVENLFAGRYRGYQASDTEYHDFEHTCLATEAVARILDGHVGSSSKPVCTPRDFELGIAAALLHDSGYIKRTGDDQGTGAKYTLTDVDRSTDFAEVFLREYSLTATEIILVQFAIRCTGVNVEHTMWDSLNEREWLLGCALGAGDILGQMAAPNYPERLPALYREYQEALAYSNDQTSWLANFKSAEDLMRNTRSFYHNYARRMLDTVWGGVHDSLASHFRGKNKYFEKIETNLDHIDIVLQRIPAPGASVGTGPDTLAARPAANRKDSLLV